MGVSGRALTRREREGKREEGTRRKRKTLQRESCKERKRSIKVRSAKRKEDRRKRRSTPSPLIFTVYPPQFDLFCILDQNSATSPTISTVGAISKGVINIYGMLAGCRHSL